MHPQLNAQICVENVVTRQCSTYACSGNALQCDENAAGMRHNAGCCALLRSVLLGRHELLGLLVGADLGVEGRRQVRHGVGAALHLHAR